MPRVQLDTSVGKIVIELFENEAPNTVANFITLTESGYYDGTKFHRVISEFMVQGGDPNSKDEDELNDGKGGPGYTIKCESHQENARRHFRGSLSMAHAGRDSGGSQFFMTHLSTPHLDPPNPDAHTVFGRIIEGQQIVESIKKDDFIQKATVVRKRSHEYKVEKTPEPEPLKLN
ncbi:MAG: peptidylprolyl isomerase [Planctomycetaceae bacterium]|nr:peptidylprolyl isomerase [Planctomycetaceae bacterium]